MANMKNPLKNIIEDDYISNEEIQEGELKYVYMLSKVIYDLLERTVVVGGIRQGLQYSGENYKPAETISLDKESIDEIDTAKVRNSLINIRTDITLILKRSELFMPNTSGYDNWVNDLKEKKQDDKLKAVVGDIPSFQDFIKNYLGIIEVSLNVVKNIYKTKNLEFWLQRLKQENQKIIKLLSKMSNYTDFNNQNFIELLNKIISHFTIYNDGFQNLNVYEEYDNSDDIVDKKDIAESKPKEPTEEELLLMKEKEKLIKKVNDTYFELCADLIDLENQVPYLAKGYYEKFLASFKEFKKHFNMPLSNDTSLEIAKKANRQLGGLLDYITNEISAKSYVEWGN